MRGSTTARKIAKVALPTFHVSRNLQLNRGFQLYTIGTPAEDGQGGDRLVPECQRDEIVDALSTAGSRGLYIPMPGGEHITDWCQYPEAITGVESFLFRSRLSKGWTVGHPIDGGRFSRKQGPCVTSGPIANKMFAELFRNFILLLQLRQYNMRSCVC